LTDVGWSLLFMYALPPRTQEAAGSSAGALELPGACARTLLKMYQQQAPGHLTAAAQHVLQKQLQK
jgi:hypothetical protein